MASGTTFDPSREWLGIESLELGDPRRVLGLPATGIDRDMVLRAADERLATLRCIEPGPFTIAHSALLKRVEQCRDELLASVPARSAAGFAPPPPPGGVSRPSFMPPPAPAAAPAFVPPPAPVAPPPVPSAFVAPPTPHAAASEPASTFTLPPPPPPPPPPPAALEPRLQPVDPPSRSADSHPPLQRAAAARAAETTAGEPTRRRRWWVPVITLGLTAVAALALRDRLQPYRDRLVAAVQRQAESNGPTVTPPPTRPKPESAASPVAPPSRPTMVDVTPPVTEAPPVVTPPPVPDRPPDDPGPTDTPPIGVPAPPPERSRPVVRDDELTNLLVKARAALAAEQFDQADAFLALARDAAADAPAADRVAGWKQLAAHARRFAMFRGQALEAGAGRDFDVGDKRISVIEVTDRLFIFRHEGQNKRIPLDQIPEAIAMTMTKKWFAGGGQAANHLFIGARYLTRAEPDAAAARKAWLAARQGGEDVSLLMPLLDDPLLGGPPPRR